MIAAEPVLFASGNPGKFAEASALCSKAGIRLVSPVELAAGKLEGLRVPVLPPPQVVEDADSYAGNARLKADAFHLWSGLAALADDTGLEVEALQGRPGIHSARYAGPQASGRLNIEKLLAELQQLEQGKTAGEILSRKARFVCVLVLAEGQGCFLQAEASLDGEIAREPRGGGGFGYDSVFVVEGFDRTLAELKEEGRPVQTHRILALQKLIAALSCK